MKSSKQEADLHNLSYELEKMRDNFAAGPSKSNLYNASFNQNNSVDSQQDLSGKQDY